MKKQMAHNRNNNSNERNRLIGQVMATEKKKVVIAVTLIALMAVMWVRVLTRKGPEAALG